MPELLETAYEILVAACRLAGWNPPSAHIPAIPERSMAFATASRAKKSPGTDSSRWSAGKDGGGAPPRPSMRRPATVGELMRIQMRVSESADSRIRKGLLRVAAAAGQLGKCAESMVLPLELLQQFKLTDFHDQREFEAWKIRNLKVLEAGLLLHPSVPLEKSDVSSQRLSNIIRCASERPLEIKNNFESMQAMCSTVLSLAGRSLDGSASEKCHWADGGPLNIHLYQRLLEACFDINEEGSIVEEVDDVLELIKKTWAILGINQMLHNMWFLWTLFQSFVTARQVKMDLLFAAESQLTKVEIDAKTTKDPIYWEMLRAILSSIIQWSEKRLLAYHDTFGPGNIDSMHCIISLGISAAEILVENISHEHRTEGRELDIRDRVDNYIRSSLRAAFVQRKEKTDSSRRLSTDATSSSQLLSILTVEIDDLAAKENELFSPILKKWHPLAAGVAAATLHACYGNELRRYIKGVREPTPDFIQVLKAADELEKKLVLIAVDDLPIATTVVWI